MSRYLVNPEWPHRYREHEPGEEFEANLEPDEEARATAPKPSGLVCLFVLDDSRVKLDPAGAKPPRKRPKT